MVDRCPVCNARWRVDGLTICLDCGAGSDHAAAPALRLALDAARVWLAQAGPLLVGMDASDPRRVQGAAQLTRRQATYRALETTLQAAEAERLTTRYPFAVRWSRQKGWLLVRDVFDGDWLEVDATHVPRWWVWVATENVKAERARRAAA